DRRRDVELRLEAVDVILELERDDPLGPQRVAPGLANQYMPHVLSPKDVCGGGRGLDWIGRRKNSKRGVRPGQGAARPALRPSYGRRAQRGPGRVPRVAVLMRHRLLSAQTYRTLPSPPQPQLAVGTPVAIVPRCVPSGANTSTPPGPVANRLPSLSTFMPSGRPGLSFLPAHLVASKKTLPLPRVPSALTGKAIHTAFFGSELA